MIYYCLAVLIFCRRLKRNLFPFVFLAGLHCTPDNIPYQTKYQLCLPLGNPPGSTSHASLYVLSNSAVCLVVLLEVHLCLPLVQVQFNFQRNISKVLLQISSADDVFKNTIWI